MRSTAVPAHVLGSRALRITLLALSRRVHLADFELSFLDHLLSPVALQTTITQYFWSGGSPAPPNWPIRPFGSRSWLAVAGNCCAPPCPDGGFIVFLDAESLCGTLTLVRLALATRRWCKSRTRASLTPVHFLFGT